jgi:endonuclease/exonuclease/phosphatase family metal-dependent hydrolase
MRGNDSHRAWGVVFVLAAAAAVIGGSGCGQAGSFIADGTETAPEGAGESASPLRADGRDGAARGLSVLAWNMERFPLSPQAPRHIEDIIEEMQPDVVGVSEIENDAAFRAMVDSIPGYAAVIADDPRAHTRVGMFYRWERVAVSEVETLFKRDQYAFPRPPLKVRVEGASFDFDFVAVHLKARMDPWSEARREAACRALDAWVEERLAGGFDPDIMIAGDWNDKITGARARTVFRPFLDAPARYRFLTQEVADEGDYSYIPWGSLIDHVLVTTPLLEAYGRGTTDAVHLEDWVESYVHHVSDHRPIRVQFTHP